MQSSQYLSSPCRGSIICLAFKTQSHSKSSMIKNHRILLHSSITSPNYPSLSFQLLTNRNFDHHSLFSMICNNVLVDLAVIIMSSSIRQFVPLSKLGEGSFATVYRVRRLRDNQIYALKKIKMTTLNRQAQLCALNEVRLLASLDSPYIVKYHEAFFDCQLGALCLVMELAEDGDLRKRLKTSQASTGKGLPQSEIWKLLLDMSLGLHQLHEKGILHRDLKCQNIFVSTNNFKIGDMNVSKLSNGLARTQTGTPYYASPQIWQDRPYDAKSDIWSLGCVIYEAAALRPPFMGNNMHQLHRSITAGKYPSLPLTYSPALSQLISRCLKVSPTERPTTTELLSHSHLIKLQNMKDGGSWTNSVEKQMLATIGLPNNFANLNYCLPEAKYPSQELPKQKSVQKSEKKKKSKSRQRSKSRERSIDFFCLKKSLSSRSLQKKIKIQMSLKNSSIEEVAIAQIKLEKPQLIEQIHEIQQIKLISHQSQSLKNAELQVIDNNKQNLVLVNELPKPSETVDIQVKLEDEKVQQNIKATEPTLVQRNSQKQYKTEKKKRRVLVEVDNKHAQTHRKSRSKSLKRTERQREHIPKERKQLGSQILQKNQKEQSKYWQILHQAKRCLQHSHSKGKKLF